MLAKIELDRRREPPIKAVGTDAGPARTSEPRPLAAQTNDDDAEAARVVGYPPGRGSVVVREE